VTISGYEIHAGISTGKALATPLLTLSHGPDGAISDDRQIIGTYLHGLFEQNVAAQALLTWAGIDDIQSVDYWQLRENDINKLAEMIATHVNTEKLMQILEDAR
jgi:adenosylcobyric acid synthase